MRVLAENKKMGEEGYCETCHDYDLIVKRCAMYRTSTIDLKAEREELLEKVRNAKSKNAASLYTTIAGLKDDVTLLTSQLESTTQECARLRVLNKRCLEETMAARNKFALVTSELRVQDNTLECYDRALGILRMKVEEYEFIMSKMTIGEALKLNKQQKQ